MIVSNMKEMDNSQFQLIIVVSDENKQAMISNYINGTLGISMIKAYVTTDPKIRKFYVIDPNNEATNWRYKYKGSVSEAGVKSYQKLVNTINNKKQFIRKK